MDKNVCTACCLGELGSYMEDCFDDEDVFRRTILKKSYPLLLNTEEDFLLTSYHPDFEGGIWYSIFATVYSQTLGTNEVYLNMDTVVFLDLTSRGARNHVTEVINKIRSGWIPPEIVAPRPRPDSEETTFKAYRRSM